MKKRTTITLLVSTVVITACAYHRFQSIATCEFEARNFLGTTVWESSNCLGAKDADSHLKQSVDEVKGVTKQTTTKE